MLRLSGSRATQARRGRRHRPSRRFRRGCLSAARALWRFEARERPRPSRVTRACPGCGVGWRSLWRCQPSEDGRPDDRPLRVDLGDDEVAAHAADVGTNCVLELHRVSRRSVGRQRPRSVDKRADLFVPGGDGRGDAEVAARRVCRRWGCRRRRRHVRDRRPTTGDQDNRHQDGERERREKPNTRVGTIREFGLRTLCQATRKLTPCLGAGRGGARGGWAWGETGRSVQVSARRTVRVGARRWR